MLKEKRYIDRNNIAFIQRTEDRDLHKKNAYVIVKMFAGWGKRSFLEYDIDIVCSSPQQERMVVKMLEEVKARLV